MGNYMVKTYSPRFWTGGNGLTPAVIAGLQLVCADDRHHGEDHRARRAQSVHDPRLGVVSERGPVDLANGWNIVEFLEAHPHVGRRMGWADAHDLSPFTR